MPSTTGIRRRLSPALLAGAPYRIGDRMAERYVVKDAIGLGPLGYVFRAADEQKGIDVAVKMIHPRFVQTAEEREAFARAVEPARRFMQPSLARVHDLGVDQGWPYLTYSFLDGLTLRRMIDSRLAKGQTFTLEEVEPFLGQLAAALEAAHPLGRPRRPQAGERGHPARHAAGGGLGGGARPAAASVRPGAEAEVHPPVPGARGGLRGRGGPRADLYALGVLVGEMLTGLTPDEDIPELRLTAPELPEAVEGFYRRALNERPEARFRSVRELYEEFVALLAPAGRGWPCRRTGGLRRRADVPAAEVPRTVEALEPLPEPVAAAEAPPCPSPWPPRRWPRSPVPGPAAGEPGADRRRRAAPLRGPRRRDAPATRARWSRSSRPTGRPLRRPPPSPPRPGSGRWRSLRLWDAESRASRHRPLRSSLPRALARRRPRRLDPSCR